MKLDWDNLASLPVTPANATVTRGCEAFSYKLPDDFAGNGTTQLVNMTGFFDELTMDGIEFTFTNGSKKLRTEVFGVSKKDGKGLKP